MPQAPSTRASPRVAARGIPRDVTGEIDSEPGDEAAAPPPGSPAIATGPTQSLFPNEDVQKSLRDAAAIVSWVGLDADTWSSVERRCSIEPIVRPRDLACLAPRVILAAIMNAEVSVDGNGQVRPLTFVEGAKAGLVWRVARRMMGVTDDIDPLNRGSGSAQDEAEEFYRNPLHMTYSFTSSNATGSERSDAESRLRYPGTSTTSFSPPSPEVSPQGMGVLSGIAEVMSDCVGGCQPPSTPSDSNAAKPSSRADKKHHRKHHRSRSRGELPRKAILDEAKQRKRCFQHIFNRGNRTSIISTAFFLIYMLMSLLFLNEEKGWGVGDCFYFAIVTLTTVGYGDMYPTNDTLKIYTILYVHFALVIVAMFISNIQDVLLSAFLSRQRKAMATTGIFRNEELQHLRNYRFGLMLCLYLVLLVVGSLFFGASKDGADPSWNEQGYEAYDKSPAINGLYLTVITLTTVGYGDYVPNNPAEKVFGIFFMIIAIPLFTTVLASFTEMCFGEQKDRVSMNTVKSMSEDNFGEIQRFTEELTKARVGNDCRDGQISRLEFLCFLLVRNGIIEIKDIGNVMTNFRSFDKGNTGFIGLEDVEHFLRHGSRDVLEEDSDDDVPRPGLTAEFAQSGSV